MKNKLLKQLLLPMLLLCGGFIYAQTVSGTVSDATGPLPGVNVLVKGTTNGTQTDFDGNYTLNNVNSGDVLVFSFLGFATQELSYNGQATLNVTLAEDAAVLDEVVVIGYGTTTVKDATGAVASVKAEDFNGGVISTPEQLIQGKTAGVQITSSSGEPGAGISLNIRGASSFRSNNNPLFVVDGIPLPSTGTQPAAGGIVDGGDSARNPLSFINPNDIESMSILKDASATAIYGARAANGVVIITTKSGKAGSGGKFEFTSNISISSPANEFDLFDANQYRAQQLAIAGNPVPNFDDLGANTNWQDVITRSPVSINNNLAYSKNYGSGNIRGSFSYINQLGVLENSSQERITGRINASHRLLNDKLRLTAQLSAARVNDEAPQISSQAGASGNLLGAAYSAPPTWPNLPSFFVPGNRLNPRNILENFSGLSNTNRYLLNGSAEYDITNELTAKVNLGYDYSDAVATSAVSSNYQNAAPQITGNGRASRNSLEATSKLLEATLNYRKEFEKITVDVIGGYTFQDFRNKGFNSQGFGIGSTDLNVMHQALENTGNSLVNSLSGVPYQQFGYDPNGSFVNSLNPLDNTGTLSSVGSGQYRSFWYDTFDNTDEIQSFFVRAIVDIGTKWIVTGTMRADGSTRFGPNNKYGYFPSGAIAYKLHEEDFIGDNVSTLKLRASAGVTGNESGLGHNNYSFRQRFGGPGISNGGDVVRPGLVSVSFENDDLKWESTTEYNFGIDYGFNNDRLRGSVDIYRRETNDLLIFTQPAQPADQPFFFTNLEDAVVVNQGVEFALGYDFIQSEDTTFSVDFNISYNDNVVEDTNRVLDVAPLNGPGLTGAFAQRIAAGQPLGSFFMAEYSETNGVPDFNADDKDFVGKNALPDINAGLSLNFSKGNWDANAFFAGQFGFYVYNNTANAFLNRPTFVTSRNGTPDGVGLLSQEVSTLYLEKGDFVRLQNLSVGYNVPLSGNGTLDSLRLSLNGQNVFLITDYSGLDPEVSSNTGDTGNGIPGIGIDYTSFPRPRTFTLGINATF